MNLQLDTAAIVRFQNRIYDFYAKNKRDFPWRQTTNPYYIFVSEVMLQQTQASRVVAKYNEFIKAFPDFEALSKASLRDIYVVWQGMGYNRRAKYLKESATIIVEKYKGILPRDVALLDELPGIGYNTACSICAFAFNMPVVFIETNIRSVFIDEIFGSMSHFFTPVGSLPSRISSGRASQVVQNEHLRLSKFEKIHDNDILPLVEQALDHKNPHEWYWALMDYGSYLKKTIGNPSRKSKHYTKQSTFKGSDRELRGKILKLLSQKNQTEASLIKELSDDRVSEIINKLIIEGLLKKRNNILSIT